jgi:hypothetical protein
LGLAQDCSGTTQGLFSGTFLRDCSGTLLRTLLRTAQGLLRTTQAAQGTADGTLAQGTAQGLFSGTVQGLLRDFAQGTLLRDCSGLWLWYMAGIWPGIWLWLWDLTLDLALGV